MQLALTIAAYVVLAVVFIAALIALIGIPIIMRWRGKYHAANERLTKEIESEKVLRPFERGNYRSATAPGYPTVKNSGQIALTKRRLVFVTFTGKTLDISLDAITGLRESKVFKGAVVGGWTHLVIAVRSGEIAFLVTDTAAWIKDLTKATGLTTTAS